MSIKLEDYVELLEDLSPHSREALEANWHEATKVFSPRRLDNYLKGVSAIRGLGRGDTLVETWIVQTPHVAKEVGEDVVADLATASLMLASKTSGAVIELLLASAPTAASRLGDAELFLKYLQFINILIAQAPRGVRPMLDKLEVLFQHLTLGGLRRWALWGAHAHRTNYEEQIKYFGLESKESLAMLQKERKGTLLVDVQRRINMYLRALWARDFFMRPTSGDFESREGYRPYIEDYLLHLPDAFDDFAIGGGEAGFRPRTLSPRRCALRRAHRRNPATDLGRAAQPDADGGDFRDRGCAGRDADDPQVPWLAAALAPAASRHSRPGSERGRLSQPAGASASGRQLSGRRCVDCGRPRVVCRGARPVE